MSDDKDDSVIDEVVVEYLDRIAALEAELEKVKGERDRQYEFNAGQIAKVAALEAENERLRADDAMITAQIGQLEEERDALEAENARLYERWGISDTEKNNVIKELEAQVTRLTAPVSDELIHEFYSGECEAGVSFDFLRRFQAFIVRLAKGGADGMEDGSGDR